MKVQILLLPLLIGSLLSARAQTGLEKKRNGYSGKFISGTGDTTYLHLLDQAYRMMEPDPELENLSMLYKPEWNGFAEGPTWKYWWIQNSFGPTYTMLPFMDKAYQTFIYNSQALWFNMIGNGVRKDNNNFVGPPGVLMDCARNSPTDYFCKQGDYQVKIHDWPFGFTTAGVLLQAELMLIRRDTAEITHYLPLMELSIRFIDSRRDSVKNIFLIGTAGNLLAPSYAGSGRKKADGTYEMAYLAEISVNYIAALNRVIELEKIMHRKSMADLYSDRVNKVRRGLSYFKTEEGYFIRSLDADGTKHGLYRAAKHGYFEAAPNQDAMAFRVADDRQAMQIYQKIKAIPGLRPHKLILPNYPSYDDMYDTADLFHFGEWVNGGHWTTCEARMQLGYYRVNAFDDARAAFEVMLTRARHFRLDNPLTDFGGKEYQPNLPVNCVYDSWGAPGGFLRGLFEYEYKADGLVLYPHIPPGITSMQQQFPVFFGKQKIFISVSGDGKISSVTVNGKPIKRFTAGSLFIQPAKTKGDIYLSIGLGGSAGLPNNPSLHKISRRPAPTDESYWDINLLREKADTVKTPQNDINNLKKMAAFLSSMQAHGLSESYEAKHAELILNGVQAIYDRRQLKKENKLYGLPEKSLMAADQLYIDAVTGESDGLIKHLEEARNSTDARKKRIAGLWQ